jgi:hypothetical protein
VNESSTGATTPSNDVGVRSLVLTFANIIFQKKKIIVLERKLIDETAFVKNIQLTLSSL